MAKDIFNRLKKAGIRVELDDRDHLSPGYKFNDLELRGVPVRIEIGPRDVKQNAVVVARRHIPGKEGKVFSVSVDGIETKIQEFLQEVHDGLYQQALDFRNEHTYTDVDSYDALKQASEERIGFFKVYWDGSNEDEDRIKDELKLTLRCYPTADQNGPAGRCFLTGNETSRVAIFSRAY